MRRFLCIVVLAATLAAGAPAAGVAAAIEPAETRELSGWRAFVDLLEAIFGASEGDGSPEWDPNGAQAPQPPGGGEQGLTGGSVNRDGSPEIDPNG